MSLPAPPKCSVCPSVAHGVAHTGLHQNCVALAVLGQRFNEPCLRSLIKTRQTHTHKLRTVCVSYRDTYAHTHTGKYVWLELMMM